MQRTDIISFIIFAILLFSVFINGFSGITIIYAQQTSEKGPLMKQDLYIILMKT